MQIHIQIKLKGNEFPDPEELQVRNKLEDKLINQKIGEIIDIGAGLGVMDVFLEVVEYKSSVKKVDEIIKQLKIENITTIRKVKTNNKKKLNYKVGDIVKVPLQEKGYFGYGQILTKEPPVMAVKFYKVVTGKKNSTIKDFNNADWILTIYCFDNGITKDKTWKIIGNIPIENDITLPMFYGEDPLTGKLFLHKHCIYYDNAIETTWDEIKRIRAQPDGVAGYEAAEMMLTNELRNEGLFE